jgi:energy-converting hydrogenase Eha subunit F
MHRSPVRACAYSRGLHHVRGVREYIKEALVHGGLQRIGSGGGLIEGHLYGDLVMDTVIERSPCPCQGGG